MQSCLYHRMKNFVPCLGLSIATGVLSAIIVTAFKLASEYVIHLSASSYDMARKNPAWIPVLIVAAALVGLVASRILLNSKSCRGGGIPTSVAAIQGIVSFKWLSGIFLLPVSALLTFLCGIPLGTEGPCVQMGTAIGDGIVSCTASKKHKGWRRYIMTGGASAGFSIATSSPVAAIIFSMEELHKTFSPILISITSICVISAQATTQLLSSFGIGSIGLFHLTDVPTLTSKALFAPLLVGAVCGCVSILFTRLYHFIDDLMHRVLKKLPIKIVFPVLFASICTLGIFLSDSLGTGHSLTERLFKAQNTWYILILIFLVRAVVMTVSNTSGVTGGVFLPTIAFGAITGSLCAKAMISLGWLQADFYVLIVILGITSFLGATSRIPITASIFAVESLGGISNVLPVILATTVAYLVVEASGLEDFTDTIITAKIRSISKGKEPAVIETSFTVAKDSFVVGKELRDILWPQSCTVLSYKRKPENRDKLGVAEGDVFTVLYKTYDPKATAEEFDILVGEQSNQTSCIMDNS